MNTVNEDLRVDLADEIARLNRVENEMTEDAPEHFTDADIEATPEWKQLDSQRNYCQSLILTIDLLRDQFHSYKDWMQKI